MLNMYMAHIAREICLSHVEYMDMHVEHMVRNRKYMPCKCSAWLGNMPDIVHIFKGFFVVVFIGFCCCYCF